MRTDLFKEISLSGPSLKLVIILALVLVVSFQGSRGLYETTEGRYSESAREMVAKGNYLEPTLDGHPHWTKPPLTYWGIAAGLHLLGTNAWGARAFLIPSFLVTVLAMFMAAQAMWGRKGAGWAALVYATSLMTGASANVVSTDTLLTMWIALATAFFWTGMVRKQPFWVTLFWVSTAGAFLTKGPPGILFLLGIVPVYFLFRKTDRTTPPLFTPGGLLLFLLVGLGWYLYEAWQHPGLAGYWLGYETIGRLAGMEGEFHNPEWYAAITVYGPILLLGPLPWIGPFLFWWAKLKREGYVLMDIRRIFKSPQRLYMVLAFFVPLVIFSLSRSKLPLYMLPLFIPLSLFFGRSLHLMASRGFIKGRSPVLLAILSVLLLVSLKGIAGMDIGQTGDMKWFHRDILERTEVPLDSQDLYVMHHKPLYGLEFYRGGLFRRINYDHVSWKGGIDLDGLPGHIENSIREGKVPCILVRDFNKKKVLPVLPPGMVPEISGVSEDWLLIRLERSGSPDSLN